MENGNEIPHNPDEWAYLPDDYYDNYHDQSYIVQPKSKYGAMEEMFGVTPHNIVPVAVGAAIGLGSHFATVGMMGGTTGARALGKIGHAVSRGAAVGATYSLIRGDLAKYNPVLAYRATKAAVRDPYAAAVVGGVDYLTGGRASRVLGQAAAATSGLGAGQSLAMNLTNQVPRYYTDVGGGQYLSPAYDDELERWRHFMPETST